MVKDGEQITLEQARENLMGWMDRVGVCFDRPVSMSAMGYAAFPAARFKSPQGAALAVSRLAKQLIEQRVQALPGPDVPDLQSYINAAHADFLTKRANSPAIRCAEDAGYN